MQILTNKYGLPETLVKACAVDTHRTNGDISTTQLIDGPQVRILKKMHNYEVDVMDNMYMLMGTALHHILERANITEERKRAFILTAETIIREADNMMATNPEKATSLKNGANWLFNLIPVFFPEVASKYLFEKTMTYHLGGMDISGTFDLYDKETGILYDYKFCSTFNWTHPEARIKWKKQLNIYALMLENEGFKVNGIKVVAFFRDWNSHGLIRTKDYPAAQVQEINIPLHPLPEILDYMSSRVALHLQAENGNIPNCTGEDRWAKGTQYAVKASGGKKALRVVDVKGMADQFIEENRHKYNKLFIEVRPGESSRCKNGYCPVSKHCKQHAEELRIQREEGT